MSKPEPSDRASEHWLDRIKSALGLQEPASLREGLEDALEEAADVTADISPKERALLRNVLGMRDVRVADIMTPRARIVGIGQDAPLSDLLATFKSSSHARLVVYGETLDDPQGMVHIRDFLSHLAGSESEKPFAGTWETLASSIRGSGLIRPVLFVPPSTPALDLMVRMQGKRLHMALVIDEYGETDGLVSMEDLVEVIVGDIDDEHDTPEPTDITRRDDGTIEASGEAGLAALAKVTGIDLSEERAASEVDSIGGYVTALAGRVPEAGERIEGPNGLAFTIVDAVPRQIRRLIIHPADDVGGDGLDDAALT